MSAKSDRYQRGLKKIKELYGEVWNENVLDDIFPEMNDSTVEFLFGDVNNTERLDALSTANSISQP